MRLTRKLLLALIVSVMVILGAGAWLQVRREIALFDRDMAKDHQILGRILAVAVARTWQIDGEAAARALLDEESRRSGLRFRLLETLPFPLGTRVTRDELHTTVPLRIDDRSAAIDLAESLGEQRAYIRTTVKYAVASSILLVVICGVAAIAVGVMFVGRPTRQLVEKARRVGAGDLSRPLLLRQRDELGELAGEINTMCTRLADAGERLRTETSARLAAVEQLRHADRLKTVGMLAAGVAHELGTPLNVVAGRAEMIESGEVAGAAVAHSAKVIGAQAVRMTRIIRQLLDFARHSGGERARTALATIAAQTVALLQSMASKRGVTLRVGDDGVDVPAARIDGEQIQQALTNLVVNAIHATASGGQVTVGVRREIVRPPADHGGAEGPHVRVEVRDTGAGMDAATVAHIFEPFFTTKQVGEGTGLGLAVAYGIVRDHGGWIDVHTRVGEGTTMALMLPIDEAGA